MMSHNVKRTKRTNLPDVGVSAGAALLVSKACVVRGASVVAECTSFVEPAQADTLAEAKIQIMNII